MRLEDIRGRGIKITSKSSSESFPVAPPTHAELEQILPGYRDLFKDKLITLGVVPPEKEVPFLDVLKRHGEDSQAWYFCDEWVVRNDVIMGQFMRRMSVSSEHTHRSGIHEFYAPLAGDFYVRMKRGDEYTHHRIPVGGELEIPIETYHGAFTMQDSSLALIVMRGATRFSRDQWHTGRRPFEWRGKK